MSENQKKQKGRFSNMAKHYSIDEAKKVIVADIVKLTPKEEAEVQKFVKFGFTVEYGKPKAKATIERLNDDYILNYLAKLPAEESKQALATYEGLKNEVAKDDDGKKKTTRTGKDKTRGFNAGRNWFAKTYPADASTLDADIKKAGKEDELADLWEEYEKKNKTNTDAMTADEYKRDFYWKNVFVRPAKAKK